MNEKIQVKLAKAIEDYLVWMAGNRYAQSTIYRYKNALRRFRRFLETIMPIAWEEIFTHSVSKCFQKADQPSGARALRALSRYLYTHGQIPAPISKPLASLPRIYEEYLLYFKNTRGTSNGYLKEARSLLAGLCDYLERRSIDLAHIRIENVDLFLARQNAHVQPCTKRRNRSHLRNFFKYLYHQRRIIKRDLAPLIVGATLFARSKPPKFLRPHEIRQVFEGLCTDGAKGLRQAAMVHLGFCLGLRPKEVSLIRLDDLLFSRQTIDLPCRKSDNPIVLPLPEAVIKAIAAYLIGARPQSPHRELFLNLSAPYAPVTAATVCREITEALKKVNTRASAYWLRHTYAQNMLQAGAGIFEVKEMLGHECIQSTKGYLHIDLEAMRGLFNEETF